MQQTSGNCPRTTCSHVGNSPGEWRRVEAVAATLQVWTTKHISAIFNICLSENLAQYELHESAIQSWMLSQPFFLILKLQVEAEFLHYSD